MTGERPLLALIAARARNGVIGRLAARHGIATPLNDWLTALIRLGEPPS